MGETEFARAERLSRELHFLENKYKELEKRIKELEIALEKTCDECGLDEPCLGYHAQMALYKKEWNKDSLRIKKLKQKSDEYLKLSQKIESKRLSGTYK